MVTIKYWSFKQRKWIEESSSDTEHIFEFKTENQSSFSVYIDYKSKGSETEVNIRFGVRDEFIDDSTYFWQCGVIDANGTVVKTNFKFIEEGQYRIPISIGDNDDNIAVSVEFKTSDASSIGEMLIYIKPDSYLVDF